MKRIMLAAFLLLATAAQAEEMMFYERPAFMADSMPLKIDCVATSPRSLKCTGDYKAPAFVPVKVVDSSGHNLRVERANPLFTGTCMGGMCSDDRNKAPIGDVILNDTSDLMPVRFVLIDGYYIFHDPKNPQSGVWAYKRGFGPLADKYPPYAIFTESVQRMSSNTDSNTFDVWCSPQSDTCDFNGKQVARQELAKLMPKKSSEWCDMEFCYATESFEGVIGINPGGSL